MADIPALFTLVYAAFNQRDIDRALACMSEDVHWPKASEGGHVTGKAEIRAYWTRQWQHFDPHVEPLETIDRGDGVAEVRVHQLVRNLTGDLLSDSEVWHTYTLSNGLIARMDLKDGAATPSAAFAQH